MRLAAQAKLGFYPASDGAIAQLVKHLRCKPPNPEKKHDTVNIIDPCCGKGDAIKQIADALLVPEEHVYTVELDKARSEEAKALMPRHQHLGPASFLGVQITGFSYGLAYVNPPFDDELGGGRREEQSFAERATRLLVGRGILVLVCPFRALAGNKSFCHFLDANFDEVAVYKFPDGHRPYNEIVFIGRKRPTPIPADSLHQHGRLHQMNFQWGGYIRIEALPSLGEVQPARWNNGSPSYDREADVRVWEIRLGWKPHVFKKTMFTDDELEEVIAASPLNRMLEEVKIPPPEAPPLPLDKGHLGLILASGMLDGPVQGPHGVHVVRGSSHKVEYHNKEASESVENPESGAVTTKDVYSQRMVTVIRCVEQDGVIYTHSNEVKEKDEDDEEAGRLAG